MRLKAFFIALAFLAMAAVGSEAVAVTPTTGTPTHHRSCSNCGVITGYKAVKTKKSTSGIGIVTGAIIGGVAGHAVTNGNSAGTAVGAVGGGVAGNAIEKHNTHQHIRFYKVYIRMDNGGSTVVKVNSNDGLRSGRRVQVVNGNIRLL